MDRKCEEIWAALELGDTERVARDTAKEWLEQMFTKIKFVKKKSEWDEENIIVLMGNEVKADEEIREIGRKGEIQKKL